VDAIAGLDLDDEERIVLASVIHALDDMVPKRNRRLREVGGRLPPLILSIGQRTDALDMATPQAEHQQAAFCVSKADEKIRQIPSADPPALAVEPLVLGQVERGLSSLTPAAGARW
jgi:hypothetical protein